MIWEKPLGVELYDHTAVRKTPLSCHLIPKRSAYQDRLGTKIGKVEYIGAVLQALLGDEAVMELVQELQDIAPEAIAEERAAAVAAAAAAASQKAAGAGGAAAAPQFGRRWIWAQTVT